MTYQVRIEPSGHSFTAHPEETLLEAALRSGINVKYSCSNGTCGECRVRLLQGEVEQVMPADYHFSPLEKSEGYVLMCANRAASDLVIQAQEAHTAEDIPLQNIVAKVAKVDEGSEHVRILQLRTPRTKTLRFLAGQHVCLNLPGVGSLDLAIASCPCNGMHLQFHVPRLNDEPFSRAVFEGAHIGQRVEVEGPYGDVTLDDDSERPLLLLAMGTDFAPIKSLIEHAINLDLRQPVRLIWLSSEAEGHYVENYCRAWAEVLDDYRFELQTMALEEPGREELQRLKLTIDAQLQEYDAVDAYIAGSRVFREVAREHLLTRGVETERIFPLLRRLAPRTSRKSAHG